jgi:hypothetical protein
MLQHPSRRESTTERLIEVADLARGVGGRAAKKSGRAFESDTKRPSRLPAVLLRVAEVSITAVQAVFSQLAADA